MVDDDPNVADMLRQSLPEWEFKVTSALDGLAGLQAIAANHPDILLLDIIMPGRSGVEVLEEMHKLDQAAKIIMITAVEQDGVDKQLLELGATAILHKPFSYGEFKELIKKYLG